MLSLFELNSHNYPTTPEIDENLQVLLGKLNRIRVAYGIPMTVTSGLRTLEKQLEVNPHAPKSHHITGEAADIYDPEGLLKTWVDQNLDLIEKIGLWMEDFASTPTWVHFQITPPKSGHRFFIP
jgi:hypothetical protein